MNRAHRWVRDKGCLDLSPLGFGGDFYYFSLDKTRNGLICLDANCVEHITPDNFIALMKEAICWAEQEMSSERD